MERYVCIHGHFYQPPRENPWLEDIEVQDSAYPYHNWNERISAECYQPNSTSRILDHKGLIRDIVNNYANISFNFGPTLLDWLEKRKPDVYQAIIEADRESQEHFSGHGSAMAQAYNHMIMPLANTRDKHTQVIWGIKDFQRRFNRMPEGMWLPETAVDLETLKIMAEHGIIFTVLSPYQARRFQLTGSATWCEVCPEGIDSTRPYRLRLGHGCDINIFFYNGPISSAVAFEKLLSNGEHFAHRLLGGFEEANTGPQLVNIATDGETFGHHHRHGDMALAYALDYIRTNRLARITNYGEYLELHPPTHEVELKECTSWSCAHGVERWRNDCGCKTGMGHGANQAWRTPLRNSLNWLRNTLIPLYEKTARIYLKDPWAARNDYIRVVNDRSAENLQRFLNTHAVRPLEPAEIVKVLKLLETQRNAMLMFTSCGWFFDNLSGIETIQIIRYAGRLIQLAQELFRNKLEPLFLEVLSQAKGNGAAYNTGAQMYEHTVKKAMVNLNKVGAHYAISSLFETYDQQARIYCYLLESQDYRNLVAGKIRLIIGRVKVASEVTREAVTLFYAVLSFGEHNLSGGVREYENEQDYLDIAQELTNSFERADLSRAVGLLDKYFRGKLYSLKHLFRDQQRQILDRILASTLADIESEYRRIYQHHASLMRYLKDLGNPQPKGLQCATELVLNTGLRRELEQEVPDLRAINSLIQEARTFNVKFDEGLGYSLEKTLKRASIRLRANPTDLARVANLAALVDLTHMLPFEVDLGIVQNIYYGLVKTVYREIRSQQEDEETRIWVEEFTALGEKLRMSPALLKIRRRDTRGFDIADTIQLNP